MSMRDHPLAARRPERETEWERFFEKNGERWVQVKSYGNMATCITVEELYEHFRARLLDELIHASNDKSSLFMRDLFERAKEIP